MSALAREIGVTPSMISQIERGQSLPSVETLFALAAALEVGVDTFFGSGVSSYQPKASDKGGRQTDQPESVATAGELVEAHPIVVRKENRAKISIEGGIRWELLTPEEHADLEFLELIYGPGAESSEHLYPHQGYEMAVVLEGRFDVDVGFRRYTLDAGDSIAFASSIPHRYVNPLQQESRAITAIFNSPLPLASQHDAASRTLRDAYGGRRGRPVGST